VIVRKDDLRPEGLHLDLQPQIGPLEAAGGLEINLSGVVLTGDVVPTREGLRCQGRLVAAASIPCSRCLEPYAYPVDRTFDVSYVPAPPADAGQAEHQIAKDEFDIGYLAPQGSLDMNDLATEQVYLSLPMKPLCSEQCRGLCSGCGVNLNTEACRCGAAR